MRRYFPTPGALLLTCLLAMRGGVVTAEEPTLACYTCTATGGDDTCLDDPANAGSVPVTDCRLGPDQCCFVQRVDDNEDLGVPVSFYRGCIEDCDPSSNYIVTEDFLQTTYQTFCMEEKCNNGPGNKEPGANTGDGEYIQGIQGIDGVVALGPSLAVVVAAAMFSMTT